MKDPKTQKIEIEENKKIETFAKLILPFINFIESIASFNSSKTEIKSVFKEEISQISLDDEEGYIEFLKKVADAEEDKIAKKKIIDTIIEIEKLEESLKKGNKSHKFYDTAMQGAILSLEEIYMEFPFSKVIKTEMIEAITKSKEFIPDVIIDTLKREVNNVINPDLNKTEENLNSINTAVHKKENNKYYSPPQSSSFITSFNLIRREVKQTLTDILILLETVKREIGDKLESLIGKINGLKPIAVNNEPIEDSIQVNTVEEKNKTPMEIKGDSEDILSDLLRDRCNIPSDENIEIIVSPEKEVSDISLSENIESDAINYEIETDYNVSNDPNSFGFSGDEIYPDDAYPENTENSRTI